MDKMKPRTKEAMQYGTAIIMVASGIVLAFLSFFLNHFDIADGVLWYIAQALVYAGSIFGVSMYVRSKVGEAETRIKDIMTMGRGKLGLTEGETKTDKDAQA